MYSVSFLANWIIKHLLIDWLIDCLLLLLCPLSITLVDCFSRNFLCRCPVSPLTFSVWGRSGKQPVYKEFVLLLAQISKLLGQEAYTRITAADALRHPFIRQDDSSLPSPRIIIDQVSCLCCPVKTFCGLVGPGRTHDCRFNINHYSNIHKITSLAVLFYLVFCSESGMLAAWLASCQCLYLSSLAVGWWQLNDR